MKDETARNASLSAAKLHVAYADQIIALAKQASVTGEPIIRSAEYQYPHEGYESVKDLFFLGDSILVAPVVKKGERKKTVRLPKGNWKYLPTGTVYPGGQQVTVEALLSVLPLFEKIQQQ